MFANVRDFDINGDGDITRNELPPGQVTMYVGHMDYNANDTIEKAEIDRFLKMFNNGRGVSKLNDGSRPKSKK
jgi:Ca2+-binding EF-hand superfamily protein